MRAQKADCQDTGPPGFDVVAAIICQSLGMYSDGQNIPFCGKAAAATYEMQMPEKTAILITKAIFSVQYLCTRSGMEIF